jgi:hypothetical protein
LRRRGTFGLVVVGLLGLVAGCSSGGSKPKSAEQQITLVWTTFFNTATPVSKRVELVEDGPAFQPTLTAQATGGAMSATVTHVALADSSHATVSFSLQIKPSTSLPSVGGAAVLVNGRWLVSKSTMCVVLTATGQHASACG